MKPLLHIADACDKIEKNETEHSYGKVHRKNEALGAKSHITRSHAV